MGSFNDMLAKFKPSEEEENVQEATGFLGVIRKTQKVIGLIVSILYHLRKVVLALPVGYYALKLAAYNGAHLPGTVGLFLQADGRFTIELARSLAVMGPLAITAGCLAMMFLSRKAMYAWAISVFSLALPVLILISNLYPA